MHTDLKFETAQFIGAFVKSRKATISFVMSVCPSVHMEQHAPTGRVFIKCNIRVFFEACLRELNFC